MKLPETPCVVSRDTSVVVIFDDGSEMVWGEEKTFDEAKCLAQELEIELRAVNYVRWHVRTFIKEMTEYLSSRNIDAGLIDSILRDGHAFAQDDINQTRGKSFIIKIEQDFKMKISSKVVSQDFIV